MSEQLKIDAERAGGDEGDAQILADSLDAFAERFAIEFTSKHSLGGGEAAQMADPLYPLGGGVESIPDPAQDPNYRERDIDLIRAQLDKELEELRREALARATLGSRQKTN